MPRMLPERRSLRPSRRVAGALFAFGGLHEDGAELSAFGGAGEGGAELSAFGGPRA
jgi:hypothetical protein